MDFRKGPPRNYLSMIRKSGHRFSEKIMLKQGAKARWRFNQIPSRFSGPGACCFIAAPLSLPIGTLDEISIYRYIPIYGFKRRDSLLGSLGPADQAGDISAARKARAGRRSGWRTRT